MDAAGNDDAARARSASAAAAVLVAAVLAVPSLWLVEPSALCWDAAAQAAAAQRVATLPGGIYVAGADHKGPLWSALYVLAWHLAPDGDRYWLVVAAFVVVLAGLTADVVRRLVVALGGGASCGLGAGLFLAAHLVLGAPEYCRVLYSRNVTVLLTAAALLLALRLRDAATLPRAAASGALLGAAVQTMPTTAVPALAVGLAAADALRDGGAWGAALRTRWRPLAVLAGAALAPLLLVPLYYAARGELEDFWAQWWTYNRVYSAADPASPAQRLADMAAGLAGRLAAPRFLPLAAAVGLLAADVARGRRRGLRGLPLVLAWAAGEAVSLALPRRFFEHYDVLLVVPTAVAAGLVASRALAARPGLDAAAPLVALAAALVLHAGAGPRVTNEALKPQAPPVRAVLDVVSEPDAFVYVWSRNATDYALLRRRAPTRFVENRWLRGEVYGTTTFTSPRFVLPGTWERWRADLAATPPVAVVEDARAGAYGPGWTPPATPIEPGSEVGRWRAERFVPVYARDDYRVDVERGRWAWVEAQRRAALAAPAERPADPGALAVDADGLDLTVLVADLRLDAPPPPGIAVEVANGTPRLTVLARGGALVVLGRDGVVFAERGAAGVSVAPWGRFVAVRRRVARPPWLGPS